MGKEVKYIVAFMEKDDITMIYNLRSNFFCTTWQNCIWRRTLAAADGLRGVCFHGMYASPHATGTKESLRECSANFVKLPLCYIILWLLCSTQGRVHYILRQHIFPPQFTLSYIQCIQLPLHIYARANGRAGGWRNKLSSTLHEVWKCESTRTDVQNM